MVRVKQLRNPSKYISHKHGTTAMACTDNRKTNKSPVSPSTQELERIDKRRHTGSGEAGLDFNYESMEDELTCPVCLELYADPLMLPCSHSVCKRCLEDIFDSKKGRPKGEDGVECPSCRKAVEVCKEKVVTLPRNLALENIVIRYTEERSKSIRKSLSLESPVSDLLISPVSDSSDLPEFPTVSKTNCELCETSTPSKAAWYCLQCEVAYCHSCFGKFHPRRGSLARHKVRQPTENEDDHKPIYCRDHETDIASIFCDTCQVLICSLCVCDGEGKHSGHKILALETACKRIRELAERTQEQSDGLVATVKEQRLKMEAVIEEIQEQHVESCESVEQQYTRLIEDITAALQHEKTTILARMEKTKNLYLESTKTHLSASDRHSQAFSMLSEACEELSRQRGLKGTLMRAYEVVPLSKQLEKAMDTCDSISQKYDGILKEKKPTYLELQSGVDNFRGRAQKALKALIDDSTQKCEFIVPHIKSPSSPGKSDLQPRIQNKYLITWGFSSTSFTGEELTKSATWTITIERNTGHLGDWTTGYLFGVGIASQQLNVKDLVGITAISHGIICTGGSLYFSHNNNMELLMPLSNLPISVTVSVYMDHSDFVILTYKLVLSGQSASLIGKRLIKHDKLQKLIYPAFTVSQRVKLLFPTFV